MESLLVSTGVVAFAEIGDKTQLLAFVLAARFKRALPIVLGILVATLLNHGLAGALGAWVGGLLQPGVLRWAVGLSFIAMALWVMVPDRLDGEVDIGLRRFGVFGTTLLVFFLCEMGDKTQVATVALAAHYTGATLLVVAGTTLGMLIADVPAVFLGGRLTSGAPMRLVHLCAALIFVLLGVATLSGAGAGLLGFWVR